jgi:putative DNA primase/helicase
MAERTRVAILSITHFSKAGASNTTKALHRFIGSIAFTGAPRAAFAVIEDAEQEGRQLLLHAKNNIAKAPQGLAFRVEQCLVADGIVASRIVWDREPVAITANEALTADAAGVNRSVREEAAGWLRELLADGALPAKQVRSEADAAGHSWATVKRAKQAGRIEHFREGGTADKGRWLWRLPVENSLTGSLKPYLAQETNVSQLGELEPVSDGGNPGPSKRGSR